MLDHGNQVHRPAVARPAVSCGAAVDADVAALRVAELVATQIGHRDPHVAEACEARIAVAERLRPLRHGGHRRRVEFRLREGGGVVGHHHGVGGQHRAAAGRGEGAVARLHLHVVEARLPGGGHQAEIAIDRDRVVGEADDGLAVQRHADGRALERHAKRVVDAGVDRLRERRVLHPAALLRVVPDHDLVGRRIDGDELEVVGGIAVEHESCPALRVHGRRELEHRVDAQAIDHRQIDEAHGATAARRVAAARHAPDAGRAAGEEIGHAIREVLGRLIRGFRRHDLHAHVVERAARVVRAHADQAPVQAVRVAVDDARRVRVGERGFVVDRDRRVETVHREERVVDRIGLQASVEHRLRVDHPAARAAMTHHHLVGGDVDPGEFEVGLADVVEDDVAVCVPARGRLDRLHRGLHLVVGGQRIADLEHGDGVRMQGGRRDLQRAVLHRPGATVRGEAGERHRRVVERSRAQHVARPARQVAGLWIARRAGLVMPGKVLLAHHTELAEGLAVARGVAAGVRYAREVRAVGGRERVEEFCKLRLQRARHRSHAEGRERHDEAVELADPVDQAVAASIGDQHIAPGATVRAVLVARMRVGRVVRAARGVLVIVGVQQIVAPAAVHIVAPGAADDPVVTVVAEELVVAVGVHRAVGDARDRRAFVLVEVEKEARHLGARVVLVVGGELARVRVVAEHVARVRRPRVEVGQRLGAGDRVVAAAAVHPVAAEATVEDVVGGVLRDAVELVRGALPVRILAEGREIDRLLQLAGGVDVRLLRVARRADRCLGRSGDAVERLGGAVAAREDAPVVADDAVLARTAGNPVVAVAADDVVVLTLAEDDVRALAAVDEVVARLAVDFVAGSDVGRRARLVVRAARHVVDERYRARDDLLRAVVVVVEREVAARYAVRADQAIDVAVVADDCVGVARVAGGRRVAVVVAREHGGRAAEDEVAAVRALCRRVEVEEARAAADDVVLALVAEDDVAAAATLDVIVAVRAGID